MGWGKVLDIAILAAVVEDDGGPQPQLQILPRLAPNDSTPALVCTQGAEFYRVEE
jgi:hypothetical protein